jgi:hypothetical protein
MQIPTDSQRELFFAATEKLSRQREALGITEAHRPRRLGSSGRGTRPPCRAEASPLCAFSSEVTEHARRVLVRVRNLGYDPMWHPAYKAWQASYGR